LLTGSRCLTTREWEKHCEVLASRNWGDLRHENNFLEYMRFLTGMDPIPEHEITLTGIMETGRRFRTPRFLNLGLLSFQWLSVTDVKNWHSGPIIIRILVIFSR